MNNTKILIIMTSHSALGDSGEQTGFHFGEMAIVYDILSRSGYEIDFASTQGQKPFPDPGSVHTTLRKNPRAVRQFLQNEAACRAIRHTLPIYAIDADEYGAMVLIGGHGALWDFPKNTALAACVRHMHLMEKPIMALGHGVAGLLNVRDHNGEWIVKNKYLTCFTNSEEEALGCHYVPFYLETALSSAGALVESVENFQPYVNLDGNIITAQNQASAESAAYTLIKQLQISDELYRAPPQEYYRAAHVA